MQELSKIAEPPYTWDDIVKKHQTQELATIDDPLFEEIIESWIDSTVATDLITLIRKESGEIVTLDEVIPKYRERFEGLRNEFTEKLKRKKVDVSVLQPITALPTKATALRNKVKGGDWRDWIEQTAVKEIRVDRAFVIVKYGFKKLVQELRELLKAERDDKKRAQESDIPTVPHLELVCYPSYFLRGVRGRFAEVRVKDQNECNLFINTLKTKLGLAKVVTDWEGIANELRKIAGI